MRIGIIVDNELDHDVRVMKEIRMMRNLGHEVSVLCFKFDNNKVKEYDDLTIERIAISRKKKNKIFFFNSLLGTYTKFWQKHIVRFIKKYEFDIIHTHDLYMAEPTRKSIDIVGKELPLILDLHENYAYAYQTYTWVKTFPKSLFTRPKYWSKNESKHLSYADGYILLSVAFKEELNKKYTFIHDENTLILPNVPDTDVFDKGSIDIENTQGKTVFLYFGVIGQRRGILEVMKAFISCLETSKKIFLLLIGPVDKADRSKFDNLLSQIPSQNVKYIPWIELKELSRYMDQSDVGLAPFIKNPQHDSGIANKIFQYMYGGLPLLVSNCKPQQILVENEKIGVVYNDFETLKSGILFFAQQSDTTKTMGQQSEKVFSEKFKLANFEKDLDQFYNQFNTN